MTPSTSIVRRSFSLLGLTTAVALAACGGSNFVSSGGNSDGGDDSSVDGGVIVVGDDGGGHDAADARRDGPSADATHPMDSSVGADTGTPIDSGTGDGETGSDAGCTGAPGVGAYVQVGSGFSPPNCGTASAPCATVQGGIDYAVQQGFVTVFVADGIYHESITISAGMTVQGGWGQTGGTWHRDCPAGPFTTTIQAPAGAAQSVNVTATTGQVGLDALTIDNGNTAASGQTLYGVFAAGGASLDVRDVVINVAAGGAGATGGAGTGAGSTPSSCATGNGATPGPSGAGTGAPVGTYSSAGYVQSPATAGTPGANGGNGTAAPAQGQSGGPTCITGSYCTYQFMVGCVLTVPSQTCGTQGTNGCGGDGTGGGNPGTPGGSSIGLFAWATPVTLSGATGQFTVGAGGNGGNGGPGGSPVGVGSAGTAGMLSPHQDCTTCTSGGGTTCNGGGTCEYGLAGAKGGTGGNGGSGGQGGGGSGGDSYCYVAMGGATVTTSWPSTFCTAGAAGKGGNQGGGTSQGADGHSSVHN